MLWWLENGSKIKDLKKLQASGRKIKSLENQPEVFRDLQDIWQAFIDLSSSRQIGLEENPILIGEIESWLNIHCIVDQEIRAEFYRIIKDLDFIRQNWLKEKREWANKNQHI